MSESYQHWQLHTDAEHILTATLDRAESSTNALNEAVFNEFEQILDKVAEQKDVIGLIIASGKKNSFIVGADVPEFTKIEDEKAALAVIEKGQAIFQKLEDLSIPTVAMIDGHCLGGGLELALACRYRVASDESYTRLGLPEVKLGIHPGWGGSVRLPRLIGALQAFDVMLTGRQIRAKAAQRLGFVDAAVPKRQLLRAAQHMLLKKPQAHRATRLQQLTNKDLCRPLIAKLVHKKLEKKIKLGQYPAPYQLLDNWLTHGVKEAAFAGEANSVATLITGATAQNLVRLFLLQDAAKQQAKQSDFVAKHVHVVGAGVMGGDIAAWCSVQGLSVTLQDREPALIAKALKRAHALFKKRLKTPLAIQAALDRLQPDIQGHGVARADVIIEAIFEDLEAKQALFKTLEAQMPPHAILASNTSSIPLAEIAAVLKKPERLVGIHFFNPVAQMPLVEVVRAENTVETKIEDALAFVNQLSRTPITVKSSPGFLVNRILMPYLIEAFALLEEGVPASAIDRAAVDFGMPMGPIELADTVGLDICLSVAKHLANYMSVDVPTKLQDKVDEGSLGRKSGRGFYQYQNGRPVKSNATSSMPAEQISQRLMARFINEAAACLRESIVADADSLDLAMVFGTGFAPFLGGPMQYARSQGYDNMINRLESLQKNLGDRFKPDSYWAAEATVS